MNLVRSLLTAGMSGEKEELTWCYVLSLIQGQVEGSFKLIDTSINIFPLNNILIFIKIPNAEILVVLIVILDSVPGDLRVLLQTSVQRSRSSTVEETLAN